MMMHNIIETDNLTKYYGQKRGIIDVNLKIREGEIFGFLGPNGAGKTTTIRILLDFIRPTKGVAKVFGRDSHKDNIYIKQRLGYIPGEFSLYEQLTVNELLQYFNRLHRGKDNNSIELLAKRFDVNLKERIKNLSHGMRQKVVVISAFMKDAELLILDEPTQGLDPLMQEEFYKLLKEEKDKGKTIFLSSHILSEVEKVCDRVGIIREGRLVEVEEVHRLKEKRFKIVELTFAEVIPDEEFKVIDGVEKIISDNRSKKIYVRRNINELIHKISHHQIEDITIQEPSLEGIFLEYYKK